MNYDEGSAYALKQRIITGILIACLFAIPFYLGDIWFAGFTLVLALITYTEWLKMAKLASTPIVFWGGLCALIGLFTCLFIFDTPNYLLSVLATLTLLYLVTMVFHTSFQLEQAGVSLIGFAYIGFGFLSLAHLRVEAGLIWTLSVLLLIVFTDTGAYFIGRKWGKRKLAPKISPNKTIEGAMGGLISALVLGIFLQSAFQPFESYAHTVFFALLISASGQLGDLVESAIKRQYGVKDSGNLLPGHGGVFDRTDSWIFVFLLLSVLPLV